LWNAAPKGYIWQKGLLRINIEQGLRAHRIFMNRSRTKEKKGVRQELEKDLGNGGCLWPAQHEPEINCGHGRRDEKLNGGRSVITRKPLGSTTRIFGEKKKRPSRRKTVAGTSWFAFLGDEGKGQVQIGRLIAEEP